MKTGNGLGGVRCLERVDTPGGGEVGRFREFKPDPLEPMARTKDPQGKTVMVRQSDMGPYLDYVNWRNGEVDRIALAARANRISVQLAEVNVSSIENTISGAHEDAEKAKRMAEHAQNVERQARAALEEARRIAEDERERYDAGIAKELEEKFGKEAVR